MNLGQRILVIAPSRLHFGLLSFGHPKARQFGGLGAMVEQPGLRIEITPASALRVVGWYRERVQDAARRWADFTSRSLKDLHCQIDVTSAPRLHTGLGVGTQVALSVAAGLNAWYGVDAPSAAEFAASVGRGERSAIGTYGFLSGGLIAELGKLPGDRISPLLERVELPAEWRFVLISPPAELGLSGLAEQDAFRELPPVPVDVTQRLTDTMCERLLPAAKAGCFGEFSESLFDFGHIAGNCFASIQGGAYHGPLLTRLVERIRAMGLQGVGQSSWGPTLFVLCRDANESEYLRGELLTDRSLGPDNLVITAPNQGGARIVREPCNP